MERRLVRAERRAKTAGTVAVVGVAAALVLGLARPARTQTDGKTITAPFKVIDEAGKGILQVDSVDGKARLALLDQQGNGSILLLSTSQGGAVSVNNQKAEVAAMLVAGDKGGDLSLWDPAGELGASMGFTRGGGDLKICRSSKLVARLWSNPQGGDLSIGDCDQKERARLFASDIGCLFALFDKAGNNGVGLATMSNGGYLCLNDKDGNSLFTKP